MKKEFKLANNFYNLKNLLYVFLTLEQYIHSQENLFQIALELKLIFDFVTIIYFISIKNYYIMEQINIDGLDRLERLINIDPLLKIPIVINVIAIILLIIYKYLV